MTRIPEWLKTDHPREMIEAALAHVVRNRVEAAYARSDLFERQRVLMDAWARYLARGLATPSLTKERAIGGILPSFWPKSTRKLLTLGRRSECSAIIVWEGLDPLTPLC